MDPTAPILAVALYAALNALILLWLAFHVGVMRGRLKIFIGDGGDPRMIRAMRGQANFVENVPLILLLLLMMALIGTPALVIHMFGLALTIGRVLHGLHFTKDDAPGWQRQVGAGATMLVLLLAALGLVAHVAYRMVVA